MSRPSPFRDDFDESPALPSPTITPREQLRKYAVPTATVASSVLSVWVAYPLDTVKSRLQTYKHTGVVHCVTKAYGEGGVKIFFKGSLAPMFSITCVRTVSMTMYQNSKDRYSSLVERYSGINPGEIMKTPGTYPTIWTIAVAGAAGATSGSLITAFACPFELTKLSAQTSNLMVEKANQQRMAHTSVSDPTGSSAIASSYKNKGTLSMMRAIYRNHGLKGLYTGFRMHLLRDTLGTGLYFITYESVQQLYAVYTGEQKPRTLVANIISGSTCGVVGWAFVYPIDSAKARYQMDRLAQARGSIRVPKIEFFKRNMYRGFWVAAAKSGVTNAIFFSCFEYLRTQFEKPPQPPKDESKWRE